MALRRRRQGRAFDALGVVLRADNIVVVVCEDDFGETVFLQVVAPLLRVFRLHNDHVAALATLLEQSSRRGAILERCDEFDEVSAERYWEEGEGEYKYLDCDLC